MVLIPGYNKGKDLGFDVIYRDTAKYMGILDKIENNPWFKLHRITLSTGEQIYYYRPVFIEGKYPWGDTSFVDIIKGYIKEANQNILFTYDPKDFENAINAMKRYVEDNKKEGTAPYEVSEASLYREDPPCFDIEGMLHKDALYQQSLIDEIEARINDK